MAVSMPVSTNVMRHSLMSVESSSTFSPPLLSTKSLECVSW